MEKEVTLGERIYKYRSARGLSQLELSELLDVSRHSEEKTDRKLICNPTYPTAAFCRCFLLTKNTLYVIIKYIPSWESNYVTVPYAYRGG